MTIYWKAVEQSFTQYVNLENLSVLDLELSGVKGFILKKIWIQVLCLLRYGHALISCFLHIAWYLHFVNSSDKRYPVRPVYGEYKYLPKSIWLSAVLVCV